MGISSVATRFALADTLHRPRWWPGVFLCVPVVCLCAIPGVMSAQITGDEAELNRLRNKAEEAIANEDPEGAAMAMGRAALMAQYLAKTDKNPLRRQLFRGAEQLSRSQEHGYRALALFQRAGGELPASSSVCGSLHRARRQGEESSMTLTSAKADEADDPSTIQHMNALQDAAKSWLTALNAMGSDFQCTAGGN